MPPCGLEAAVLSCKVLKDRVGGFYSCKGFVVILLLEREGCAILQFPNDGKSVCEFCLPKHNISFNELWSTSDGSL